MKEDDKPKGVNILFRNHVYKTELTIGSYYDLSIKKIGNLSKNPFILFYVMIRYISF
jgi:hypothetical protein